MSVRCQEAGGRKRARDCLDEKRRRGGREEGNEAGRNRIKDDARKINNTPKVKSDLGKGRAKIQFQTSQGMNGKTGVPGEKNH